MENSNSKYFGILKGIKEEYIDKNIFNQLLKFDIFDEFPLSERIKGESYFGLELEPENIKLDFNDFFIFNKKEYWLKRTVWEDMFKFQAYYIEIRHSMSDFDIRRYSIDYNSLITKDEKIDFLKKLNRDFLKCYENKDLLFLYVKNEPARDCKSWEEYYINEHIEELYFDNLFRFLKGDLKFYDERIFVMWREFRIYKDILEFINEKLTSLEETTKPNVVEKVSVFEDWRSDIFKDKKCRSLFDFIINEYPTEQNTSFFSMLFKFLKQKKYIKKE